MTHLTLNTGHSVEQPDSGPSGVVESMRSLLRGGSLGLVAPNLAQFRVEVFRDAGGAVFTVFRGSDPIVMCGVASERESADEIWMSLEQVYLTLSDSYPAEMAARHSPEQPSSLPWLAVMLFPTIALQPAGTMDWLGDFERCMAWALLDDL